MQQFIYGCRFYNRIKTAWRNRRGPMKENWAELLRGWLPSTYIGRIISQDGITSPQVDVLVLKSVYPKKLRNKKLYLAAGVAAAFECKTTLTAAHIEKTGSARKPKLISSSRRDPLQGVTIEWIIGNSHSWKAKLNT